MKLTCKKSTFLFEYDDFIQFKVEWEGVKPPYNVNIFCEDKLDSTYKSVYNPNKSNSRNILEVNIIPKYFPKSKS